MQGLNAAWSREYIIDGESVRRDRSSVSVAVTSHPDSPDCFQRELIWLGSGGQRRLLEFDVESRFVDSGSVRSNLVANEVAI